MINIDTLQCKKYTVKNTILADREPEIILKITYFFWKMLFLPCFSFLTVFKNLWKIFKTSQISYDYSFLDIIREKLCRITFFIVKVKYKSY